MSSLKKEVNIMIVYGFRLRFFCGHAEWNMTFQMYIQTYLRIKVVALESVRHKIVWGIKSCIYNTLRTHRNVTTITRFAQNCAMDACSYCMALYYCSYYVMFSGQLFLLSVHGS